MFLVTVNERNRIHFGARKEFDDDRNLFYYADPKEKTMLMRYSEDVKDEVGNVYWKGPGNICRSKDGKICD